MTEARSINAPPGSEMGQLIRSADWAASSLGPISSWPKKLESTVEILLRLPMPAMLIWGDDGITLYNDACSAFFAALHPRLLGRKLAEGWPDNSSLLSDIQKVREDGLSFACPDQEFVLPCDSDVRHVWTSLNYAPVQDEQGAICGVLVLFIETTERIHAEQALRDSERRMSAIFARAQVGLSVICPGGHFQSVNDALCAMLGRPREALLNLGIQEVTHPDDLSRTLEAVAHLIETGEPVSIDKRYVRPDGAVVFANSTVSRLEDWGTHKLSALAVTVDLTERKRAQHALAESEARFRALADASPALIWQLDPHGSAVYINQRFIDLIDIPLDKLRGFGWHALLRPEDLQVCIQKLGEASERRDTLQCRILVRCKDAEWRWMESYAAPWYAADGEYAGHVGISIDVNDAVRAQEELLVSNERLNLAIEGSGDGVWDWDTRTDEVVYSNRAKAILGLGDQEKLDTYEEFKERVHPDDMAAVQAGLRACLEGTRQSFRIEYRVRRQDGGWNWVLARAIVVRRDDAGKPMRMTGMVSDISEKRRSEEVVWRHANFDALTALPNRRLFRDRLDQEVRKARRTGLPLALLFVDLDRFKEANDLLGHDIGDQVLIEAAHRIRQCVRRSDTVARLGGDEFTAILTDLDDLAHVEPIAQKVNEALAAPFRIGDEVIYLSASIGITLYPNDASSAENLIRNADQAMYVAKNSGRNQFSYFTSSMQREAHDRLRLIADMRNALRRGEMSVYYQPIVDLKTGRVVKAEALLRWEHPRLGLIFPDRFIAFAEESGLITEIGDWVFRQAAGCSRHWSQRLGIPFQISVNKSPVQFLSRSHGADWPGYLHDMGMDGGSVSVEITEGLLLNASQMVVDKLLEYRDAGIQVAIDDFGTGYSSMAYLKKFGIDYLKIDQSFVREMVSNDSDRAIVRSVTAMAHELGLLVIAEGIETAEQKELLIESQCDFGQGFYFSEAVPAAEFERTLCR